MAGGFGIHHVSFQCSEPWGVRVGPGEVCLRGVKGTWACLLRPPIQMCSEARGVVQAAETPLLRHREHAVVLQVSPCSPSHYMYLLSHLVGSLLYHIWWDHFCITFRGITSVSHLVGSLLYHISHFVGSLLYHIWWDHFCITFGGITSVSHFVGSLLYHISHFVGSLLYHIWWDHFCITFGWITSVSHLMDHFSITCGGVTTVSHLAVLAA